MHITSKVQSSRFKVQGSRFIAFILFLCCLLFIQFVAPPAHAQVVVLGNVFTNQLSNTTTTASTVGNVDASPFRLRAHTGLAISPSFTLLSTAGAGTFTFGWNISVDGTNWTTTLPLTLALACNGTNTVTGYTNVPGSWLDNARYIRLDSMACTSTNVATNPVVRYGYFP